MVVRMAFNIVTLLKEFSEDANRIFVVSKKPTNEEFRRMALIVGIGIILLGVIAFIIYLIFAMIHV